MKPEYSEKTKHWHTGSLILIYTLNSINIIFDSVILWRAVFQGNGKRQKFLILMTSLMLFSFTT